MTKKKITAFIAFYILVIMAILFMYFYVQERYGHKSFRLRSDAGETTEAACLLNSSANTGRMYMTASWSIPAKECNVRS